jgi:hypothetical protein
VASTTASLSNVAVIDSVDVDRSEDYSRCNSGHRTLPWVINNVLNVTMCFICGPCQSYTRDQSESMSISI